jgi:diadenosine tetraphosphate (Ap4A) HIT family hydrolase
MECRSCRAIAGEIALTDSPRLELDEFWRAEHCHPVAIAGWLVLVLRRHARALHELTAAEAAALGHWLPALTRALHEATDCELEYVMQFAEADGFQHVHFHLIARTAEWPAVYKGPGVMRAMGGADSIAASEATRVIESVGATLGVRPSPLAG